MRSRFWTFLDWLAGWQIIPVGLLAPVFLLADRLPNAIMALATLAIPALWGLYRVARGRFFTPTPVDLPLVVWLATLPVGVWVAAQPALSLPPLLRYLYAVALFYALVNSLTSERKVELAGWATLIGTLLLVGVGLVGTAWGGSKFLPFDPSRYIPHLIGSFWHTAGFHPHVLAGVLAIFTPLPFSYAWAARTWPWRLSFGLLFLMETFVLVLTQSRGALLGFAAGLLAVAIGRDRRWAWMVPLLVITVTVGVTLHGVQPSLELVTDTVGDSTVRSGEVRLELFSHALYALQDFPFTGVGLGMCPKVLPMLYPFLLVSPNTELSHVHNVYLQTGIEHGLPGLIAFLAFLMLLWVMGTQAIRLSRGRAWEPLAIGLLAGLAAYLVHGLVDTVWGTPRSQPILWGHWGLLTAVWCWARTYRTIA